MHRGFSHVSFDASFFAAGTAERSAPQGAASQGPADLLLTNGKIYTGDSNHPWTAAVAIRGEWIAAIADSGADLKPWIAPKTRVIDLRGQFAMPGFNDAHVHLAGAGQAKLQVRFDGTRSLSEFQQRIRDRLGDFKAGQWMVGRGWDHTIWPGQKFPSRQDLDAVSADHPMFFVRVDGHVAVVNSRALEIAGITRTTSDPPGGRIERDPATGEPTGMLEEDSAMNLVYIRIPAYSAAQRRRALELAIDEAARYRRHLRAGQFRAGGYPSSNFGWENFLSIRRCSAKEN